MPTKKPTIVKIAFHATRQPPSLHFYRVDLGDQTQGHRQPGRPSPWQARRQADRFAHHSSLAVDVSFPIRSAIMVESMARARAKIKISHSKVRPSPYGQNSELKPSNCCQSVPIIILLPLPIAICVHEKANYHGHIEARNQYSCILTPRNAMRQPDPCPACRRP